MVNSGLHRRICSHNCSLSTPALLSRAEARLRGVAMLRLRRYLDLHRPLTPKFNLLPLTPLKMLSLRCRSVEEGNGRISSRQHESQQQSAVKDKLLRAHREQRQSSE